MTLLLAGDLGGTKTLLALYRSDGDQLSCVARERYISAEWPHLGPMLKSFLADHNNNGAEVAAGCIACLLYTSPSPRDRQKSRMPSSA